MTQADPSKLTSPYRWTNHPLIDMGIASLLAFANKTRPGDLIEDDLQRFASYIEEGSATAELSAILGILFTGNFIPINPNPKIPASERKEKFRAILHSYSSGADPGLPNCAYCSRPSVLRVSRDLVPMLAAREDINFFPEGQLGLALCGLCIVSLQALAIGALICNERGLPATALILSCDDPQFIVDIVKTWQSDIRKRVQLSKLSGEKQPQINWSRSRTIEALTQVDVERQYENLSSVTVYRLRNHLRGPTSNILFLPSSVIRFLQKARVAKNREAWLRLVNEFWESPGKHGSAGATEEPQRTALRNYLYEDLFDLPGEASRFVRLYFLRRAERHSRSVRGDQSSGRNWKEHIPGLWNITRLFLEEVISMEPARIDAIRNLGDTLADEISTQDNRSLWGRAYRAKRYSDIRLLLIRLSQRRIKRGDPPAVSFEGFLQIFEEVEELPRIDYLLAWDLVLIRLIEKLHETKWFEKHGDILGEEEQEAEMEEA